MAYISFRPDTFRADVYKPDGSLELTFVEGGAESTVVVHLHDGNMADAAAAALNTILANCAEGKERNSLAWGDPVIVRSKRRCTDCSGGEALPGLSICQRCRAYNEEAVAHLTAENGQVLR